MNRTAIHSKQVLLPDGLSEASVLIENGCIREVKAGYHVWDGVTTDSFTGTIMPGMIDMHVHINEPGRTEWEGFDTATKAAAAGGITTLVDMPLNATPVTTTKDALLQKMAASKGKTHVHCAFWGGLVPDNLSDLDELLSGGVMGIKVFLTHSGIDDFPNVTEAHLREAMPILKKHNAILLAHCELDTPHEGQKALQEHPTRYAAYLQSRPKEWENSAIAMMIQLCEEYNVRTHIVHLSSAEALPMIAAAQQKGLPLTVETCTHYLAFNAEEIPNGATVYKCAPPIREKANNDQLWKGLQNGIIEYVITDHSPAPPALKEIESGNFAKAWGGIAGLQYSFPAMWSEVSKRGISLEQLHQWMSSNSAAWLGLEKKGKIAAGFDADIVIWQPQQSFTVSAANTLHRHKITPYEGKTLLGVVEHTYVNGEKVFEKGHFVSENKGTLLLHK